MIYPYITFSGRCAEAISFYEQAFSAKAEAVHPYGDYVPEGFLQPPEDLKKWVMHAELNICGTKVWLADEVAEPVVVGSNIKLTVNVDTKEQAQRIFSALQEGSSVTLPPTETFYSVFHGALVDRFGVCWAIVANESPEQ